MNVRTNLLALRDLLQRYHLGALQTIAKFVGLEIESSEQAAYVQALADKLSRPETVAASISRLDGLERLVLEHILSEQARLSGAEVRADLLKQELIQSGFMLESPTPTYEGSPYRQAPRYFEDVLARLTSLGLVFSLDSSAAQPSRMDLSPGPRLTIPEPIRFYLSTASSGISSVSSEQIPVIWRAAPEAFQRDLFLFWSYVQRHEITLTSRGWIPKRHWSSINEELLVKAVVHNVHHEGDTNRLYFLHILLEEMGLLERSGHKLVTSPDSRDFFRLGLRARAERALRAWLRSSSWNELLRIRELRIDMVGNRNGRATSAVKGGRQFVMGLLKHLPVNDWILLSDLVARARAVNYEFLLPRHHNYYGSHNPYHSYNNPLAWEFPVHDESKGWDLVEARYIEYILREPLYWMGLVSLGWDADRLMAFQVSSLGAQILGLTPPEREAIPERRVIVQPNFEILALDPISDYTLSILDEFAERVKSEHVLQYHLTRESVYQAQQRGMTVEKIIAFLDRESSTPLPQNVRLTLQEWSRYHERIVFFQGVSLCQVAEPNLLDRLLADKETAPLLGRRISSHVALVANGNIRLQQLQRTLQNKGLLPTMTPPSWQPSRSLKVEEDGRIRFRHQAPSIYLLHLLAPLTEARQDSLFITPEAVAKAISAGETAERIIETLRSVHQGPLAPEVVSKIKVWGKYYGHATIKKVTLLQLKDANILKELSQDPVVGPLIVPFSPLGALAIIHDKDMEALRKALAEKGMDLDEKLRHA